MLICNWCLYVHRGAPLVIKFKPLSTNTCGKATKGTFPRGVIWLDSNMHTTTIRRMVAHEFSHMVGYGHNGDGLCIMDNM